MDVLPAIDLRNAKVVRLSQGDYNRQSDYFDNPVEVAQRFLAAGATWIHMVDLDAARSGELTNLPSLRAVRAAVGNRAHIEFGGGARDDARVDELLAAGADRVVVGSAALKDWAWFERLVNRPELAGRIALGLDARDGMLAVHGWTQATALPAVEIARRVVGWPLGAIVHTDIARDGMFSGVNIEATRNIVQASGQPVVASGGVASLEDIRQCLAIGCAGVIVGKAWYEGRLDLAEAVALARGAC